MKKYIIIFLILFCGNVYSADFCSTFKDYRFQIKRKLGVDTSSTIITDTTLNQFIREAVIKVLPIIQGIKSVDSFTTTYRQGVYSLDSSVVGILSVGWSKNDSVKTFIYAPKESWYQYEVRTTLGKQGYDKRPNYYDFTDGLLFLYPVPSINGDTIKLDVYRKVQSISASDNLSTIPQKYRVAVLEYATYLTARSLQSIITGTVKSDFNESVLLLNSKGVNVEKSDK